MSVNNSFISKLKDKMGVNEPPKLIQANFLTSDEVADTRSKVLLLKDHWKYLNPNNKAIIPPRMLPLGMYSRSLIEYKKEVSQYKNLMYENFNQLYEKLLTRLIDYFNCELTYHSETHYPGFHIYTLDGDIDFGKYEWFNFHKDGFSFLNRYTEYEKIYSCVVPIELPKFNGSLMYTLNETTIKDRLDNTITYNRTQYNVGDILVWPGNLIHSIEPFDINRGEHRITLQCHIAISKNTGIIFW